MTSPRYGSLSARTECNHCGAPVPLDAPVIEASCAQCSGQVSVPAETWGVMLRDLDDHIVLPEGEGRTVNEVIGGQKLVYEIKREMPYCEKCGTAFEIADVPVGTSRNIACTQCGDPASTEPVPPWLGQTVPNARQLYRVDPDPGLEGSNRVALSPPPAPRPVALTCPSCGAGLHITVENPRLTSCEFCNADVYLPDAVWRKLHPVKVVTPFYVRFEGQTRREREELEAAERAERQRVEEAERAERRQLEQAERAKLNELRSFMELHNQGIRKCSSMETGIATVIFWGGLFGGGALLGSLYDHPFLTEIGLVLIGVVWMVNSSRRDNRRYARETFLPALRELMTSNGYSVEVVEQTARSELTRPEAAPLLEVAVNNAAVGEPALDPATAPRALRRAKMPLLLLALAVSIVAVVVYLHNKNERQAAARATRARKANFPTSVAALQRFSFAMSLSETAKLFGKEEMAGSVSVQDSAVGWLGISYSLRYSVDLSSSDLVDSDAVFARLNELVPNRLEKKWGRWGIHVAMSQLELEHRGIRVSSEDRQLADALWAVARYGVFGQPKPSAAQLQRVKGPSLSKMREFDLAVPIESAASASQKLFTDSFCWRRTNPESKQEELNCAVDIAHPLFSEFSLTWPNSAAARPVGGFFVIADRGDDSAAATVSACLDRAFGPGKKQVRDHASGSGSRIWSLDTAGDRVALDRDTVHIESAAGHSPTKPASWSGAFAALVDALAACKR